MRIGKSLWRWMAGIFVVLAVGFVALAFWFSGARLSSEDRMFRGKLESEWIKELKYNDDEQAKEWKAFGEEGISVLLRGLELAQPPGERAYRGLYRKVPMRVRGWLPNPKQDETRGTRHCIVDRLIDVGQESPRVVPVMIRTVLKDENESIRQSAIAYFITSNDDQMLGNRLSPEQKLALLPGLLRAVEKEESGAHNAVILLRFYGEQAEVVAPVLVKALKDKEPSVRAYAAEALNRIAPEMANREGATQVLIEVGNDPDDQVAHRAVKALRSATNQLDLAVPALVKFLENTNTLVACEAIWALEWAPKEFEAHADAITNSLGKAAARQDTVGSYARVALGRWQQRPGAK